MRKLGISPSLYSKSGARNRDANSQRGQANVINGFVGADDELENAEDDEVEWTGLLLALAAVPLALVTCACRAFGRFVVSKILHSFCLLYFFLYVLSRITSIKSQLHILLPKVRSYPFMSLTLLYRKKERKKVACRTTILYASFLSAHRPPNLS